ncbi:MAG: hypothetical protein ACRYF4_04160 [Janthinobacterium lividum]
MRTNLKVLKWALLGLALLLYGLHFAHLRADFPNYSPWMDWAKYTDEGWYGDAAIRHFLRGSWNLPGDFNPGVALPVWPLLEAIIFRFSGVGIVAARGLVVVVFGGILLLCYLLLQTSATLPQSSNRRSVFAAGAVALLSVSSFLYCFTRMAIVEPLLILLTLLALWVGYALRSAEGRPGWFVSAGAVGVLVALMIGTKTTAIFLVPAVWYMVLDSCGWRLQKMLIATAVAGGTAAALWCMYLAVLLHAGLMRDFQYLFTANAYTAITTENFRQVIADAFLDGKWMGSLLYPLMLLTIVGSLFRPRIWRDPLFAAAGLWAAGYLAFLAYHANLQPRYYLVVAIPLMLLLVRGAQHLDAWQPHVSYGLALVLAVVLVQEGRLTLHYIKHPEYTFQNAAERIGSIVTAEPLHSHTVLSISGSNLSLMTGLPSICDDFGTMELEDRIAVYRPGWFVTWNYVEDDKMQALTRFYRLTRVASLPAMDDPDRNLMIVYRLDGKEGVVPKRRKAPLTTSTMHVQQSAG